MKSKKIFNRIIRVVVFSILLFVVVLQLFYFRLSSNSYDRFVGQQNHALVNEINALIQLQVKNLDFLQAKNQDRMSKILGILVAENFESTYLIALADLELIMMQQAMNAELEDIYIVNKGGSVVNTTREEAQGVNFSAYSSQFHNLISESFESGEPNGGKFVVEPNSNRLKQFMFFPTQDKAYLIGLGFYVPEADNMFKYLKEHINSLPQKYDKLLSVDVIYAATNPFSLNTSEKVSAQAKERIGEIVNNKEVYSETQKEGNIVEVFSYLGRKSDSPNSDIIIRSTQDRSVELQNLYSVPFQTSMVAFPLALFSGLLVVISLRKYIINPIKKINKSLQLLADGNLDASNKLDTNTKDEVGNIITSVNILSDKMYRVKEYINSVGKGNWAHQFKHNDSDDELAQALVFMRKNLQYLEDEQLKRDIEDEKQNWVTRGLAQFSELIYKNADNTIQLAEVITKSLVRYLHAVQGAFFIINDDDLADKYLELIAAYAYDRRKFVQKRMEFNEGLVGMCALERQTIYKTDIPKSYFSITSGLGKGAPTAILMIPLKVADKVFGVIEVATFESFNQFQIEFTEKIADSLGASLANLKAGNETRQALLQMQEQTASFEEEKQNLLQVISKLEQRQ